MHIRTVSLQDAEPLAALLQESGWFESRQHEPLDAASRRVRAHIEQGLADTSHTIFVALASEGTLGGYASVHWLPYLLLTGPEGLVSALFVHDATRGQGVGRQLLEKIQAEAPARGWARFSLIHFRHRESYQRQVYEKGGWAERPEAANCVYKIP